MKSGLRLTILIVVLVGVVAWSYRLAQTSEDTSGGPGLTRDAPRLPPAKLVWARPKPFLPENSPLRLSKSMLADLFPDQSWARPPPPPPLLPPAPSTPPPRVPSLPFKFLGTWQENDSSIYYLQEGRELLGAKQGEVYEQNWRLIKAEDNLLYFEYLPLGQTLTLRMGE